MDLFKEEFPNISGKIKNVLLAFLGLLIYTLGVSTFLKDLYGEGFTASPAFIFFFSCIIAPLWEELAYRKIPIDAAKSIGEKWIMPTVIMSSIVFGLHHNQGAMSLLFQGVGGFVWSILYIKNNYSYWPNVTVHAMWNIMCFFIY